jgi:PAS domain S-box-containing protein
LTVPTVPLQQSPEWQFLVTLNEQLRPLTDPVAIQEVAVRLIGQHLRASRVNYAHINGDEYVIVRCYTDGVPPPPARASLDRFGGRMIEAIGRGETVVVDEVETDPRLGDRERGQILEGRTAAFVAVPLFKEGRWLATFAVHSAAPRTWTRDQIALIELTADRTWAAAARARVEEQLGQTESRQTFLRRLNDAIRPLADPSSVLHETCRLLGMHLRVNRVSYGEIKGDDCVIVGEYLDGVAPQASRFPWRMLGGSRTNEILEGGTLAVNDTALDAHTPEEREALRDAGIGAYICPLLIKNGRFVAAFGIHNRSPRNWTADEVALVQEVADRIWATLEHRRAEADLRANEARLAFLLRVNDALRPLSDPAAVQETAARLLGEHLGVNRVGYAEIEGHEYVIRREYTRGVAPLAGRGSGGFGAALRDAYLRGETVVVTDVMSDPKFTDAERGAMEAREIAAFIGITLIKNGRLVAAFGANQNTPRAWTAAEIELVRDVGERTWDAVERTRAETALRAQKQRLELAVEASSGGSWTWNAATNEVDWDARFRALYGFTPEEPARPDAWLPRVHEEDRQQVVALLNEMLTSKTRESWESTFRIVRPDGTVAWIQSRGRADRDRNGNVTRLSGLDLDFNQQHRTVEAIQARRDEEHDRHLRILLETATQGIVSVDARGTIVSANPAFEMMFGWAPGELIGEPIDRLLPSEFRDIHARHRTVYFAEPHPRMMGGGLSLVGERKNGSTFPIEVSLNHIATPGGGRTFAFVTDITDRQRAAAVLRERTEELEYRTTQLSQMAWDLTLAEHHAREQIARTLHDGLQQLLVIVALNLDQQRKRDLESGAVPSSLLLEAKQHLDEAIAAARSLNLELFPPVLHRSGLPAALSWLATWARDKYKLEVEIVADPDADSSRKDVRALLFESVKELLLNVVKHAQADRVTLELGLDADDQLCITVADHGTGFESGRLDRSKVGPTGWGLFSIRERLTLLGGRLDVDSAPGRGTRVRLVAPRGAAESEGVAVRDRGLTPAAAPAPRADRHPSADPLRILIVDDHAAVRSALQRMLHERPQFAVVGEASNGIEAIARAHMLRPDVILMDVAMPRMDGIEATARISVQLPDIQILGLSMQARSETIHAIEQAGAAAFFFKGIDTQRLLDHLLALHASRTDSVRTDV